MLVKRLLFASASDEFSHLVKRLLMSHLDGILVLDILNVVWNCHIYYTIVNKLFIQSIKCEK